MGMHESEESVFNIAFAYLQRIDKLFYLCQDAAIRQDIDSWFSHLRGIYRELSVKLDPEEEKEILGTEKNGNPDLDKLSSEDANFKTINVLVNNLQTKNTRKAHILFLLDQLEVKIRKKLQKKGMLLPSKSDPRWAVLQR